VKIRDLGSLNGTFVGDEQIRQADSPPIRRSRLGPLTFRVQYEYAGEIASAPVAAEVEPDEEVTLGARCGTRELRLRRAGNPPGAARHRAGATGRSRAG